MTVATLEIMIIKPEKREAFHQNWERFQRLAKQTGLIKSTKLWVDGFGGLLLEPLSGYKYYAMTEFENIADNEKMHRKLAEESEEYREFEQQLFEQSIPNTGKCLIMTDDFIRHI